MKVGLTKCTDGYRVTWTSYPPGFNRNKGGRKEAWLLREKRHAETLQAALKAGLSLTEALTVLAS